MGRCRGARDELGGGGDGKQLRHPTASDGTGAGISGGIWILRSIHALPALREVANRFRTEVVERLLVFQKRRYGHIPEAELRTAVRLTTEMFLATIAMPLEDPELEEDKINYEICEILATYYGKF